MIHIQSFLRTDKASGALVPIEAFSGMVNDEDYIEGAIELTVDHKPVLTCEAVDYVDQLWEYLIRGLGEVSAGRAFSTYYPDMPVEVRLEPNGRNVSIHVEWKRGHRDATVALDEFRAAMIAAARTFYEQLKLHVDAGRKDCDRMLAELATMT